MGIRAQNKIGRHEKRCGTNARKRENNCFARRGICPLPKSLHAEQDCKQLPPENEQHKQHRVIAQTPRKGRNKPHWLIRSNRATQFG